MSLIHLPKHTSIGVDQLVSKVSHSMDSHQGSWYFLIANQLKTLGYLNTMVCKSSSEWEDLDVMIFSHGMNYRGTFNVFGGADDALADRLGHFMALDPTRVFCHDMNMPDVGKFIFQRHHTGSEKFRKLDHLQCSTLCMDVRPLVDIIRNSKLVFGDSHAMAYYMDGYMISRNDGLTLHGALSIGLRKLVDAYLPLTHLTICLGNIDIRHHLVRLGTPSTVNLVNELADQLRELNIPNTEVVAPLFIENESRKIPKPGWYKGKPYWGSFTERVYIRNEMDLRLRDTCRFHGWEYLECPFDYLNEDDELDFGVMERGRGVHLSPRCYRWTR